MMSLGVSEAQIVTFLCGTRAHDPIPGLRSLSQSWGRGRSESVISAGVGVEFGVDKILPTPTLAQWARLRMLSCYGGTPSTFSNIIFVQNLKKTSNSW